MWCVGLEVPATGSLLQRSVFQCMVDTDLQKVQDRYRSNSVHGCRGGIKSALQSKFDDVREELEQIGHKLELRSANLGDIDRTRTRSPLLTTSVHDVQDMDVSTQVNDTSSGRVRATILISGDDLAILDGDRTDLLCSKR